MKGAYYPVLSTFLDKTPVCCVCELNGSLLTIPSPSSLPFSYLLSELNSVPQMIQS